MDMDTETFLDVPNCGNFFLEFEIFPVQKDILPLGSYSLVHLHASFCVLK